MATNKKTVYVALDSNSTLEAADLCGCDLVTFRSRRRAEEFRAEANREILREAAGMSFAERRNLTLIKVVKARVAVADGCLL